MKLLHVSRDALALGLGAALVADCFVPDLDLMGGLQLDRVPLPSPTPQQRRDAS
ncbi:MAG: hypothetical protein IIA30_02310 [Myxococcales bacterium]|nr:hypothetical protein [Myxococcales bacterium]